jgi:cytochrome oxidase Cu insertion factor (SCO1/SenC/PrrC family)
LKILELESQPGSNKQLIPGTIYLLDPNGNMMMRYDEKATSKGMLKDIKKLLKISNIG